MRAHHSVADPLRAYGRRRRRRTRRAPPPMNPKQMTGM